MINPEHEVSKAYSKLSPKLVRNFQSQPWGPHLQDRMRANYTVARIQQGRAGKTKNIEEGREVKAFAQASLKSVANMNRSKKRELP